MNQLFEVDKKTRTYGTDKQLYEAEIHMIKSIKENEGIHVTGLAEILEVTKGAVSQILIKLDRKGMLIKDKDINNQSRLALKLTPKGETAYIHHEKLHQEFDELVNGVLKNASKEEQAFLQSFLISLETGIDDFQRE